MYPVRAPRAAHARLPCAAMGPRCFLGHGASGTSASMAPFVDGLRSARRRTRRRSTCPSAGRGRPARVPPGRPVPSPTSRRRPLVRRARRQPGRRRARRAVRRPWSCSAIRSIRPARPSGPTPGSPTGRPSRCPVLLLSGESDPFAGSTSCAPRSPLLRDAELVTYPRLGHTPQAGPRRRPGPCGGVPAGLAAAERRSAYGPVCG